jgi:hypothetical protein
VHSAHEAIPIDYIGLRHTAESELRRIPVIDQNDVAESPFCRNSFSISGTVESIGASNSLSSGCACLSFAKPLSSETQGQHHVAHKSSEASEPGTAFESASASACDLPMAFPKGNDSNAFSVGLPSSISLILFIDYNSSGPREQ